MDSLVQLLGHIPHDGRTLIAVGLIILARSIARSYFKGKLFVIRGSGFAYFEGRYRYLTKRSVHGWADFLGFDSYLKLQKEECLYRLGWSIVMESAHAWKGGVTKEFLPNAEALLKYAEQCGDADHLAMYVSDAFIQLFNHEYEQDILERFFLKKHSSKKTPYRRQILQGVVTVEEFLWKCIGKRQMPLLEGIGETACDEINKIILDAHLSVWDTAEGNDLDKARSMHKEMVPRGELYDAVSESLSEEHLSRKETDLLAFYKQKQKEVEEMEEPEAVA